MNNRYGKAELRFALNILDEEPIIDDNANSEALSSGSSSIKYHRYDMIVYLSLCIMLRMVDCY